MSAAHAEMGEASAARKHGPARRDRRLVAYLAVTPAGFITVSSLTIDVDMSRSPPRQHMDPWADMSATLVSRRCPASDQRRDPPGPASSSLLSRLRWLPGRIDGLGGGPLV